MWNLSRSLRPQALVPRVALIAATNFFFHATTVHAEDGNELLAQALRMLMQVSQAKANANAGQAADETTPPVVVAPDSLPAAPTGTAGPVAPVAAPVQPATVTAAHSSGLQLGRLQTGTLQTSGGLNGNAHGPTPMAEWRQLFPK